MMFETKETRDKKITVRFTEEEKKTLDKYIEENGYKSISDLIRDLIRERLTK